jgi:hypothetical protein
MPQLTTHTQTAQQERKKDTEIKQQHTPHTPKGKENGSH